MKNSPDKNIELARQRLTELGNRAGEITPQEGPTLVEALEELRNTIEELQVTEEELRVQNDELRETQGRLETERLKYRELFEFAPDGYLVTTGEGTIIEANRAAGKLFEVEQRFLKGKPLVLFVADEQKTELRAAINRAAQSEGSILTETELRMRPRGRADFDAWVTIAMSRDGNNGPLTLRWLVRDITARKQADEEIRRLNTDLERRVAERTADLQQANHLKGELLIREREARAEAERANRSKDEFLATFSHELRTPLNAILGWIHILRSHKTDETIHAHAIEVIERNAMSQARLINDILEISRIVSDKLSLEKRPSALVPIIEAAIDSVRPMAEERGLLLNSSLPDDQINVMGDPTRLQQVVLNILSNAIKFTPDGGNVSVMVETSGGHVTITISDTGRGIGAEFLPHVFDRFSQADSSMSRTHGGLGIGLAIVRHLVQMHGGSVSAASDGEGKGATFTINLPLLAQAKPGDIDKADLAVVDIEESRLDGFSVLVVDDEQDAREMLKVVLEQLGATVIVAGSCARAVKALTNDEGKGPDVLIADIAMPGEDGFDLIRQVRAMLSARARAIPAVALTAYASDEDRARVLAAGYQMHLPKPVSISELSKAVAKLGRKARQAQKH